MTEKGTLLMRKIGAFLVMLAGATLIIFFAQWVLSILAAALAFWLIDRGMMLWGAPSLWVQLRRVRELIKYHLG